MGLGSLCGAAPLAVAYPLYPKMKTTLQELPVYSTPEPRGAERQKRFSAEFGIL